MLDLRARGRDIRCFVSNLEQVVIDTLAAFNVTGERRKDRIGVWVRRPERGAEVEDKIAAIGVRVSKWVSYHGLSLNVSPDLGNYAGIVPCGIRDHGVTSLEDLGQIVSMEEVDTALRVAFAGRFGDLESVAAITPFIPQGIAGKADAG
jgi:lipoyl(octanoyl) transferase